MSRSPLLIATVLAALGLQAQFPFTRVMDVRADQQRPAITTIIQDSDGMIWAGSDRGLLRLDGERIDLMLPIADDRIMALAATRKGVVAALASGALLHCRSGGCDTLYRDTLLARFQARAMVEDANGAIRIGTYGAGILKLASGRVSRLDVAQGLPDDHVNDLCLLPDGRVVVATDQGLALCSGDSVLDVFGEAQGAPDNLVLSVSPTVDGRVWAGTDRAGAFLWQPGRNNIVDRIGPDASEGPVEDILAQGDLLWAAVQRNGPLFFDREQRTSGYHGQQDPEAGMHPAVDLLADREGAVWWCDGTDRLYRADPAVLIIPEHEGMDLKQVAALCLDHGRIWSATKAGLFSHTADFPAGSPLTHIPLVIDPRTPIVSLDASNDGTVWAATFGSGLFAVRPDGRTDRFDAVHGGIDPNVLSVRSRGDEVWIATLTGMDVVHDGRVTSYASPGVGFMFMALPLPDGTVLGATDGSGVVRFDGQRLQPISATGPRTYYSLAQDVDGNVWAAGPSSGLCKVMDTALVCVGSDLPPFNGDLYALATVGDRVLVFSSSGCTGYDPSTGRWSDLTARMGLDGLRMELNAVCDGPDGALWLACDKGLVRVRADERWFTPTVPVVITDMQLGSVHVPVRSEWTTPHDRNAITFRFTAPYYADPTAVRFEYRLVGLRDEVIRTREREVSYPALPPGAYTFEVRALIGDQALSAGWTRVHIRVDPPWWRRWWVIAAASLIIALLVLWAFRSRERRMRYRQRMEQEQVRFQLEALRSQVDPHFLFNSFNTLVELIETEPAKAVEQVEDLSTFFRNILRVRDLTFISLEEELQLLHTYFGLEERRFGKSILLEVSLPGSAMHMHIVPLTLQLLVENAIKHNVAGPDAPVRISIFLSDGMLVVSNTLRPRLSPARSTGFGLDSIRKRYAALTDRPVGIDRTGDAFIVRIPLIPSGA
jgi:ligand-binding sensor domain-containing protein